MKLNAGAEKDDLETRIYSLLSERPYSVDSLMIITGARRQSVCRTLARLKKFSDISVITEKRQRFWGRRRR